MSTGEGRSALVLGATGLVGSHLLDLLLADSEYRAVATLGRRPADRSHPRLTQHVAPLDRMAELASAFAVDDVFCCLGTTIKAAGSQQAFRAVDFDAVAESARLAREAGARRYLLVSAMGANPRSRIFYNRVKGEAEEAVRAVAFQEAAILRPSLILGDRQERRTGEAIGQVLSPLLTPLMVGPLRRYRPVKAATIAQAMRRLAAEGTAGVRIVESDEIEEIGGRR